MNRKNIKKVTQMARELEKRERQLQVAESILTRATRNNVWPSIQLQYEELNFLKPDDQERFVAFMEKEISARELKIKEEYEKLKNLMVGSEEGFEQA